MKADTIYIYCYYISECITKKESLHACTNSLLPGLSQLQFLIACSMLKTEGGSCGMIHQVFSLCFGILQAIKNWSRGRLENEVTHK